MKRSICTRLLLGQSAGSWHLAGSHYDINCRAGFGSNQAMASESKQGAIRSFDLRLLESVRRLGAGQVIA